MDKEEQKRLALKARDKNCLDSFVRLVEGLNLYREIYRFSLRYIKEPSDAEDVTQETIMRAYSKLHTFDPDRGSFKPWVIGIALRQSYEHLRERRHSSLDDAPEQTTATMTPEESVGLMMMEEALLAALDDLGERYRRLVFLFYVEGLNLQEIAESEGISLTNAGTLLARARNSWKSKYEMWVKRGPGEVRASKRPRSEHSSAFAEMLSALNQRLGSHQKRPGTIGT